MASTAAGTSNASSGWRVAVTTTRSSSVAVTASPLAGGAASAVEGAISKATDHPPTVRAHPGRRQSLM